MSREWTAGAGGILGITLPEGIDSSVVSGVMFLFLLFLVCALFALILMARRRQSHEAREIVLALEDLRSGRLKHKPDVGDRSGLSLVADSVQRLSQDILVLNGELQKTRDRADILEQAAPDMAIVTTDPDGQIRTFNDSACDLFGWSSIDVLMQPASILFDEEFWKELLPKLARRSFRDIGLQDQGDMLRMDGARFHAELSIRLIHSADSAGGSSSGFVLGIRDVAEQGGLATRSRPAAKGSA